MIKNYIFDFGQVLVHFEPGYMTGLYIENEADRKVSEEVIFDRLYWDRLDAGTITDSEVKAVICSRLPERLHIPACKAYDSWIYNISPIDGMEDILKEIKANSGRLYLLSNISRGFAEGYTQNPEVRRLLSYFDGLVFSGTIGLTKPKREIFEYLTCKYGLDKNECVFIDDSPKNISGAEAAGIKAILFIGSADKLRENLRILNEKCGI